MTAKIKPNIQSLLNNFYVDNCVNFMQHKLQNESIDMILTSPPYDNLRNYQGYTFL